MAATGSLSPAKNGSQNNHETFPARVYWLAANMISIICKHIGALQRIFFSKNPILLWKWVGGSRSPSEFFCVENHPKITLNQY